MGRARRVFAVPLTVAGPPSRPPSKELVVTAGVATTLIGKLLSAATSATTVMGIAPWPLQAAPVGEIVVFMGKALTSSTSTAPLVLLGMITVSVVERMASR